MSNYKMGITVSKTVTCSPPVYSLYLLFLVQSFVLVGIRLVLIIVVTVVQVGRKGCAKRGAHHHLLQHVGDAK